MSTSGETEPDEAPAVQPSDQKTLRRPAPTYPFLRSKVIGADILRGSLPRELGRSLLPQVTTGTFLPRLAPHLSETLTALVRDSGPDTRELMRRLQGESTAEVMTRAVFGPDTREVVRRLRGERAEVMNRILSGSGTQQQLLGRVRPEASVNVSRIVLSDSAFSGLRSALLSQSTVEAMAALANVGGTSATAQFVQTLRHLTDVNVRFAGLVSAVQSAQPTLAARSLGYYQNYIRDLPARPTAHQQLMSLTAGQGIGGLVAGSALLIAETEDAALALADEVDEVIIEPWRRGAAEARDALYSRLGVLDPGLPELLKGAWHETVTPGPAALVKMSTCIVEAIDRSLRAGAPDSDIEEWLPRSGRPRADFYTEEKPGQKQRLTRAARVRYILRDRKGERRLVEEQVAAVIAGVGLLQERLQAAKHASAGNLVTLQGQLLAAEGFLIQLFVSA